MVLVTLCRVRRRRREDDDVDEAVKESTLRLPGVAGRRHVAGPAAVRGRAPRDLHPLLIPALSGFCHGGGVMPGVDLGLAPSRRRANSSTLVTT